MAGTSRNVASHENVDEVVETPRRKAWHPCGIRLKHSASLTLDSPLALVGTGYASIAVGILTSFRPTPLLLFYLGHYDRIVRLVHGDKVVLYCVMFFWLALTKFVLIVLGSVLAASKRVTKRKVLMMHPWGLLILYFDILVWISLACWIHTSYLMDPQYKPRSPDNNPLPFLVIIYVDAVILGVFYYVYATYFIAAELTIIERFF